MSEIWAKGFDEWLTRLAMQPLPGGVAAAAVAVAMGAALVAKVARITMAQKALSEDDRASLEDILVLANAHQVELLHQAIADERAYRAVLSTKDLAPGASEWDQAWQMATEVPLQVAEASGLLLERLSNLLVLCWPSVSADLKVGAWLLQLGVRAGLQTAESNLLAWGESPKAEVLRTRIQALQEAKVD